MAAAEGSRRSTEAEFMAMTRLSALGPVIHEEHFRMLVLMCGIENRVSGDAAERPMDPNDDNDRELLEEVVAGLSDMVGHNAFEEAVLFPLLSDGNIGGDDLSELLGEEHQIIEPLARRVRTLAAQILEQGVRGSSGKDFQDAALSLAGNLIPHLQKEEMAVVQRLGSLLAPDVDRELALSYATECERLAEVYRNRES
jgi:hemerythrin-like domain-containing protein